MINFNNLKIGDLVITKNISRFVGYNRNCVIKISEQIRDGCFEGRTILDNRVLYIFDTSLDFYNHYNLKNCPEYLKL